MGGHSASETNGPGRERASSQKAAILEFSGPGLMMDSTACLVRSDAPHINLAFQLLPSGQYDMQEDNPIPCHLERKASLVAARCNFLRLLERRSHAGMRHVSFQRNMRSCDRSGGRIGQPECDHNGPGANWLRRDFMLDGNRVRRVGQSGTSG